MYVCIYREIDIYRYIDVYSRINNNRQPKSVFLIVNKFSQTD